MTLKKFRIHCRTLFLTYKGHLAADKFDRFRGKHKVWHETGSTGYQHTHALFYYNKCYDTKDITYFDIDEIHPNIKKVLSKLHWQNCLKYDKGKGKENSEFTVVRNTLSGNEYLWKGEVREMIQAHASWHDVMNDDALEQHLMKHLNWAKEVWNCRPQKKAFKFKGLYKWQKKAVDMIDNQNDRQVLWIYDKKGGRGKSALTDWLLDNKHAIVFDGGKLHDMAYAYNNEKIVIFDLPRCTKDSDGKDWTPYKAIECFKNGRIFSSKYQSTMKRFENCKVVIFANHKPNETKLSKDRWQIWDINAAPSTVSKLPDEVTTVRLNIKRRTRKAKPKTIAQLRAEQKKILLNKEEFSDDESSNDERSQ